VIKIKTVTAIDDHSDGEHPGVEQDLQSRQVYFRTHPLRPQPHSTGAGRAARAPDWALMLTRLLNSGERIMNRLCIAVLTNAAGRAGGLFWRLSIRPNPDTEQRATCRGSSCHRRPEQFTDSGSPGK
jgi:hypothetical protein